MTTVHMCVLEGLETVVSGAVSSVPALFACVRENTSHPNVTRHSDSHTSRRLPRGRRDRSRVRDSDRDVLDVHAGVETTVDLDDLTGDERRLLGGDETDDARDLFGFRTPA